MKALVLHDNISPDLHPDLYGQLLQKFNVASKDVSCKDLARRNYLSCDPGIWTNPNPVPFHYEPTIVKSDGKIQSVHKGKAVSDQSIINIMNSVWKQKNPEYWKEGNRATSIFKLACLMCKWGVDKDYAIEYFVKSWESQTMDEIEIVSHVENAYKTEARNFGILEFKTYHG